MVIDYFHIAGVAVIPNEANPPLVIYPNAPLALAFAFQRLKAIRRGKAEILESLDVIEHAQFSTRDLLYFTWQLARDLSAPNHLRFAISKVEDHGAL